METTLPQWTQDLIAVYKSDASNQFIIHGNTDDKLLQDDSIGTLDDYFLKTLLGPFKVVLVYDVGNGLRCIKGIEFFKHDDLPSSPKLAVETITEFLRFISNNNSLNDLNSHVAVIIKDAQMVAGSASSYSFDANATASMIRDWSTLSEFTRSGFATFLITENINDLHPLLVNNDRACRINIPLPNEADLRSFFTKISTKYPIPLSGYSNTNDIADQLVGVTLFELESMLKQRQFTKKVLVAADIVKLKKQIIEKQSDGLIEFIESDRTLDDLIGQEEAKKAIRAHIALWKANDIKAIPMGYLFAAPIGVGKNFLVECIAGEAGVPVVMVKNFRTKWVGDTESKQEKIIRLIRALGRCFVFFDEADATLGKRDSGDNDGGLSQRIYSVWATEMSNPKNRGKIVWLLASSRADRIEIDLKRPGRVDVIMPLFPAGTDKEGFSLLQGLCKREGIIIPDEAFHRLYSYSSKETNLIPIWLTAGAAEAIAKKAYIKSKTEKSIPEYADLGTGVDTLMDVLIDYQPPVALSLLEEQIRIAADNCSDTDFIPEAFKGYRTV